MPQYSNSGSLPQCAGWPFGISTRRPCKLSLAGRRGSKPAPELAPVHQEINVIGHRAEEARDLVDEFLDRAVMATASRVRIVHGHGMGILKKIIAELLSRHPHVAKFYQAPQQEGGAGATIVELRE